LVGCYEHCNGRLGSLKVEIINYLRDHQFVKKGLQLWQLGQIISHIFRNQNSYIVVNGKVVPNHDAINAYGGYGGMDPLI
jgi:hypothetical protein